VLVDPKKDNRVRRIDYYDSAMVLMKTLSLTYGSLSVREEKNLTKQIEFPIRWDMADVSRGTVSTLEFFSVDKTARLDASLFKKRKYRKITVTEAAHAAAQAAERPCADSASRTRA
jgi:outer membrane lipoprotein-sorting protein